jgi:hypothetical protein
VAAIQGRLASHAGTSSSPAIPPKASPTLTCQFHPDAEHTWLICRPCHLDLTTGRVPRGQREAEFKAYQSKRRRLAGQNSNLL